MSSVFDRFSNTEPFQQTGRQEAPHMYDDNAYEDNAYEVYDEYEHVDPEEEYLENYNNDDDDGRYVSTTTTTTTLRLPESIAKEPCFITRDDSGDDAGRRASETHDAPVHSASGAPRGGELQERPIRKSTSSAADSASRIASAAMDRLRRGATADHQTVVVGRAVVPNCSMKLDYIHGTRLEARTKGYAIQETKAVKIKLRDMLAETLQKHKIARAGDNATNAENVMVETLAVEVVGSDAHDVVTFTLGIDSQSQHAIYKTDVATREISSDPIITGSTRETVKLYDVGGVWSLKDIEHFSHAGLNLNSIIKNASPADKAGIVAMDFGQPGQSQTVTLKRDSYLRHCLEARDVKHVNAELPNDYVRERVKELIDSLKTHYLPYYSAENVVEITSSYESFVKLQSPVIFQIVVTFNVPSNIV